MGRGGRGGGCFASFQFHFLLIFAPRLAHIPHATDEAAGVQSRNAAADGRDQPGRETGSGIGLLGSGGGWSRGASAIHDLRHFLSLPPMIDLFHDNNDKLRADKSVWTSFRPKIFTVASQSSLKIYLRVESVPTWPILSILVANTVLMWPSGQTGLSSLVSWQKLEWQQSEIIVVFFT